MKDILVIGESCRDIFIYCDAPRLCPDIPVPVLNITNQSENVGMAKNVQRNIMSYIPSCDILTNLNWQNITKTRYVHEKTNHMFFRVDTPHNINKLNLEDVDYGYKIIVISDYNKGFITESDIEEITKNHDCVFLDTKKILGDWANNCKFIKINDFEYQNSKDKLTDTLKNKIIHTKGDEGCEFQNKQYKVKRVEVKDTSGAGDSFMAALVINYLNTNDIVSSIKFANDKASKVVTQIGVGII
jgi:D-beta-D-heptose 7-phosphate kinase/D-beta-D-heptose 1-phosphate adenosyltransferase